MKCAVLVSAESSLEDLIHVIAASRLINATQYAAALGLAPKEWKAMTVATHAGIQADAYHILPGTAENIATTITWLSGKYDTKLFDHR